MKNVANKSAIKVYIIQNIDKKIPLETIARNKDLSLEELMSAMEAIVASGTKLNLDYCLEEELDDNELWMNNMNRDTVYLRPYTNAGYVSDDIFK